MAEFRNACSKRWELSSVEREKQAIVAYEYLQVNLVINFKMGVAKMNFQMKIWSNPQASKS